MIPSVRYDDGFCRMFVGDAIDVLSELPEKSIHCCVTSPPYFGLRSYLAADHPDKAREGGTQETPEQYVAWLVEVFRGVWRVLRDDGTCWINLGDFYNAGTSATRKASHNNDVGYWQEGGTMGDARVKFPGLKPKDLCMMPARVALALQADGWYLRSQIVWTKPNPMPESVTDRPTQATEMVYLLSKKPRYFYDWEAVKEPHTSTGVVVPWQERKHDQSFLQHQQANGKKGRPKGVAGFGAGGRNLRNYWQISTRPYPGSHYATFPPELPLRCIKAGTSEHGVCSECGAPWRRVLDGRYPVEGRGAGNGFKREHRLSVGGRGDETVWEPKARDTIGFEPTCSHGAEIEPATVLDPFSGSGTTGLVARKLGRRSVLIDLDDRNVRLLEQRMGFQGVLC